MPEKRNISRDAETDRCIQRANALPILAERELSAFMSAVEKCFGAEQARYTQACWTLATQRYVAVGTPS
jgi:hypothetical protein